MAKIDTKRERRFFRRANQRLRRGRKLWIWLYCRHIRTAQELWDMAERMKSAGLYASGTSTADVQYSILKAMYRMDPIVQRGLPWVTWESWLVQNGWRRGHTRGHIGVWWHLPKDKMRLVR